MNFSEISDTYKTNSLVQSSAGESLINLLFIDNNQDILDVGCGPGNLTKKLRDHTNGKVIGIDASEGMINEARRTYPESGISFFHMPIDLLDSSLGFFDIIFCNSTFQWFKKPETAIRNLFKVLNPGGRIGIQSPATAKYCPNFVEAIENVKRNPLTKRVFEGFELPWLFLEKSDDYNALFEKEGFKIAFSRIDTVESCVSPKEAFTIFSSGAIAGYLNPEYYNGGFDEEYEVNFKRIVSDSFENQAENDGRVKLRFNRIFLVGIKE